MPSISSSDDASLATEGEGIAEVIEQLSSEYVHHKHSRVEVSERKLAKSLEIIWIYSFQKRIIYGVCVSAYFSEEEIGETKTTNELFESPVSVEGMIGSHQDVFIHGLLEINLLEWSQNLSNIQKNFY